MADVAAMNIGHKAQVSVVSTKPTPGLPFNLALGVHAFTKPERLIAASI